MMASMRAVSFLNERSLPKLFIHGFPSRSSARSFSACTVDGERRGRSSASFSSNLSFAYCRPKFAGFSSPGRPPREAQWGRLQPAEGFSPTGERRAPGLIR